MKPIVSLPQLRIIDERLQQLLTLANYDPIFKIVQQRFLREINHHLTSLKSTNGAHGSSSTETDASIEQLKLKYTDAGKEHAVIQLITDMTRRPLSEAMILILAEILFGQATLRDREMSIQHSSGEHTQTPAPGSISKQLRIVLEDFNSMMLPEKKKRHPHPILLAAQLHHSLTVIHPFKDWNGRIARLMLNIALMKGGCMPVLIGRTERRVYYETLEAADRGDMSPLASFLADKQLESIEAFTSSAEYLSIKAKYELEQRLQSISSKERCLVLTEDSTSNNLLAVLLKSSGFNMEETNMISYEGCSKLASANLFSIFVKEKMPHMHILVHRDRDYLTDAEIEYQHETFHRIDVRFFYTEGTDVESYFLNPEHIHHCYPRISLAAAKALVEDTINDVLPKSIDYLYKKEFGNRRESSTHLYHALVTHVNQHRNRFTHGKTAKRVLEHKIQDVLHKKPKIDRESPALAVPQLAKIAHKIWR